ncbi:MAG: hypothetical protein ACYTGP_04185 [Planctomycetota bacterium]|jgi:hypothetical protein
MRRSGLTATGIAWVLMVCAAALLASGGCKRADQADQKAAPPDGIIETDPATTHMLMKPEPGGVPVSTSVPENTPVLGRKAKVRITVDLTDWQDGIPNVVEIVCNPRRCFTQLEMVDTPSEEKPEYVFERTNEACAATIVFEARIIHRADDGSEPEWASVDTR